ncbi:MAG TPA: hypothetical protein VH142_02165 [Polyangiaceae bacterium]|jgi:hypothetical protein|nr:hypothetical protein [Polyangiaceae bacterium]
MKRWKVIAVASLVTACGGSVFTTDQGGGKDGGGTNTGGSGGGSSPTGGSAGTSTGGKTGTGGSSSGTGGATATGGAIGNGGTVSSGGVAGSGGTVSSGGVVGVGGTISNGGVVGVGGMTAAGGSPNDAGGVTTACPPQPPATDVSCRSGLVCSYGVDSRPSCREVYTCSQGSWSVAISKCVEVPDCLSLPTSPLVGNPCPTANQYCEFSSHLTCACTPCTGIDCPSSYTWDCLPPPSSPCPAVPPDEGQPCDSVKGNQCSYAFCGVPEYVIATCSSKTWSWDFPPCAISSQ